MDFQKLAELLITGGLAGIIGALAVIWKTKRDAEREDRKQKTDDTATAATAADTIAKAATSVVALHDAQIAELKALIEYQRQESQKRFDAYGSEIAAYETRFDQQVQKFLREQAARMALEEQVNRLRDELARRGAQFELADTQLQSALRENGAMKTKLFEFSVGISALTKQVREAGLEPAYILEVPAFEDRASGRLPPIDVQAAKRFMADNQ